MHNYFASQSTISIKYSAPGSLTWLLHLYSQINEQSGRTSSKIDALAYAFTGQIGQLPRTIYITFARVIYFPHEEK